MKYEKVTHFDYLPKRWDKAIYKLGSQFCISEDEITKIVFSVRLMRLDDNDRSYRRAWRMLLDLL